MQDIIVDYPACMNSGPYDGREPDKMIVNCCFAYLTADPGIYTSDFQACACVILEEAYGWWSDQYAESECDSEPNYKPDCESIEEIWGNANADYTTCFNAYCAD